MPFFYWVKAGAFFILKFWLRLHSLNAGKNIRNAGTVYSFVVCFSLRVGHIIAAMAAVDLRLALYRRQKNGARRRLLYSVYTNESIHHICYRHRRLLRTSVCDVLALLEDMAGD